jgi:hypothetical protein
VGTPVRPYRPATLDHGRIAPCPARRGKSNLPTRHSEWYPTQYQPPYWLKVEPVTPAQLATLYRALRKGREDIKDEPGAADFYFGEMEMRRQARHDQAQQQRPQGHLGTWASARIEHAVLWLYWLVSGYALRAWRALAAVTAVLVLFAVLCVYGGGFASQAPQTAAIATPAGSITTPSAPPPTTLAAPPSPTLTAPTTSTATADTSFGGALVYGARTVIGLTRDPQPRLTRWETCCKSCCVSSRQSCSAWRSSQFVAASNAKTRNTFTAFSSLARPLRYVGVPPTCRSDGTRTLHDAAAPQMRTPGLIGR